MTTDWRKLNGVPVLAAREGRRRKRVKDRPLAEMVAEYLALGKEIIKCPTKWANGSHARWEIDCLFNGVVPPKGGRGDSDAGTGGRG